MRPVGDFNDVAAAGVDHDGVAVDALGSEIMDVALMDVSVQEIARMMVIHHADECLEAVVRDILPVADAIGRRVGDEYVEPAVQQYGHDEPAGAAGHFIFRILVEIGRASCRERV